MTHPLFIYEQRHEEEKRNPIPSIEKQNIVDLLGGCCVLFILHKRKVKKIIRKVSKGP